MKAPYDAGPIAALPMYDWPERRADVDAEWSAIRDRLRAVGIVAPDHLVRRNGDMPPVPGGIRDAAGHVVAPDPASLPLDDLDLPVLWRHPQLVFAQTCWGPLETSGLGEFVTVVGQPDYSIFEGGGGELYSSAILTRRDVSKPVASPDDGRAMLPLDLMRGARLAYNSLDSMSGMIGLTRDLAAAGEGIDIFRETIETSGHRNSVRAVVDGKADICAIDCRSWHLAKLHDPAAGVLEIVGWTARRKGLPFVTSSRFRADAVRIAAAAGDPPS